MRGVEPPRNVEYEVLYKDGSVHLLGLDVTLTRDGEGRPSGAMLIARDITERRRAEEQLRLSTLRYRALAEENERLYRQQLDIAVALLNIPSEIGPLRIGHLYRSATEAARVGGDFYDVFEVKDGKVALLIGDVCGHGIRAARTATLVKDVVHAFVYGSLRPHQVLRRANALLVEKGLSSYVTLFVGVLSTPERGCSNMRRRVTRNLCSAALQARPWRSVAVLCRSVSIPIPSGRRTNKNLEPAT